MKYHKRFLVGPKWINTVVCQLVLAGFVLVAAAHAANLPPLDPVIGGLHRTRLLSGAKAIEAINRLHGMPINIVRGFVADYSGAGAKAAVWVSEAESASLAQHQVDVMIAKMKKNPHSPFTRYRTLDVAHTRVIGFDGMGQVHYVFVKKAWVYWISADPAASESVLHYILKNQ